MYVCVCETIDASHCSECENQVILENQLRTFVCVTPSKQMQMLDICISLLLQHNYKEQGENVSFPTTFFQGSEGYLLRDVLWELQLAPIPLKLTSPALSCFVFLSRCSSAAEMSCLTERQKLLPSCLRCLSASQTFNGLRRCETLRYTH